MMNKQHLEPPEPKKRPSSEALYGDAKRANQSEKHSMGMGHEEKEAFGIDIANLRYKHEQRKLRREQEEPGKSREKKPVRQRHRS